MTNSIALPAGSFPQLQLNESTGLYSIPKPLAANDIIEMAQALIGLRFTRLADPLTSPHATREFLCLQLGGCEHETFSCLFLDNRHRVLSFEKLFYGTIDGATVHPREVVKRALANNAAAVIFCHNHPSGDIDPSEADQRLTRRLKEALALIDVRVLDHFIVGGNEASSFAEKGLI